MRKSIDMGNGMLHIFGSNRPIQIQYATPDWSDTPEPYFRFKNSRHYLGNIVRTDGYGSALAGYDGIENWSFSNGLLVKFNREDDDQSVFAYYYYLSGYDHVPSK